MSTIEVYTQTQDAVFDSKPEFWTVEDVALEAKRAEFEPPLTIDEGLALTGLLNCVHPKNKDETSLRYEIVMARERIATGDADPRITELHALWKQMKLDRLG